MIFMVTRGGGCGGKSSKSAGAEDHDKQLSVMDFIVSALRKSMVSTCRREDQVVATVHQMEIGWPTDVQHITHVTFDRFHGFLGLPVEFEVEVPCNAPSASASVCGVSAESMQWSYDKRRNCVPTILLVMQETLYARGGLKAEGIFRINPENSHEEHVREQLNRGIVPEDIDVHCLSGLIKAWFRELPAGVLDALSPEQVLQCTTEEEFVQLIKQLKPTERCLLNWAIDLMADVVEQEEHSKMNARNIAMVFAPNMTQMLDPVTALVHAVQVMNLLKILIMKRLRERGEDAGGGYSPILEKREDASCPSMGPASDDDEEREEARYSPSGEDGDDVESLLSEVEECCFLRQQQLDERENAKDEFRKQLQRILLCRDHLSPAFNGDSCVALISNGKQESSFISTSDDDDDDDEGSRSSSVAFRPRDGCRKTNRVY